MAHSYGDSVTMNLSMAVLPGRVEEFYVPGTAIFTSTKIKVPRDLQLTNNMSVAYALSLPVLNLGLHKAALMSEDELPTQQSKQPRRGMRQESRFIDDLPGEYEVVDGVPYPLYPDQLADYFRLLGVLQHNGSANEETSERWDQRGHKSSSAANRPPMPALRNSSTMESNVMLYGRSKNTTNYWGEFQETDALGFAGCAVDFRHRPLVGLRGEQLSNASPENTVTQLLPVVSPNGVRPITHTRVSGRMHHFGVNEPRQKVYVPDEDVVGDYFTLGHAHLGSPHPMDSEHVRQWSSRRILNDPDVFPVHVHVTAGVAYNL